MATNNETVTPEKEKPTKKVWYKTGWGIVAVILLLPFFAIWYVWAKTNWSKKTKWIATGAITLFVIFSMALSGGTPPSTTTTSNQPNDKQALTAQKAIFDIPSLLSKSPEEIKTALGAPKSSYEPNQQQASAGIDQSTMEFEKDGQALLVTYHSKTKAIIDLFLEGDDKKKVLAVGNLDEKSKDYVVEAVKQLNDSSKITGIKVQKKLASELDGSVNYNAVAFEISNSEPQNWTNCRMKLNDKFKYETSTGIKAQDKIVVPFSDFTTSDGTRFNFLAQQAKNLYMSCDTNMNTHRSNYFTIK